jgi:hypothetical protein
MIEKIIKICVFGLFYTALLFIMRYYAGYETAVLTGLIMLLTNQLINSNENEKS